jgi:hypothetical protein
MRCPLPILGYLMYIIIGITAIKKCLGALLIAYDHPRFNEKLISLNQNEQIDLRIAMVLRLNLTSQTLLSIYLETYLCL